MSSDNNPPPIGFVQTEDVGPCSSSNLQSSDQETRPKIKLTWIDKIFRFFYSKEEFEAYLIEKELKSKAKKDPQISRNQASQN